mgnify:FL=1
MSDIERKEVITYFGKPVESLSRKDLIDAIYVVMEMYENARKERAAMFPFVDKRAMLMGSQ